MDERRLAEITEYWSSPTGHAIAPPGMVELAQKDIGELVGEVRVLRECLDPGKTPAILHAMWEQAERLGHPEFSSRHALTTLVELAELGRAVVDHAESAGEFFASAERFSNVVSERDGALAEVDRLRKVLDDIYPSLASRAMQLQEAGEARAAAVWSAMCQNVASTWPQGTGPGAA